MDKKSKAKLTTEEIVAKNVAAFRFMLGLDYERFAERAHLTPERVREIENGVNVLDNGIELLRISEACGIQYSELFEDADSGATGLKMNAKFPDAVYKNIFKMIRKYPSNAAFARLISVHPSAIGIWLNGKAKPGPMAFQNILAILKLKSYDLEAMVDSVKKEKPEIKVADVQGTIEQAVSVAPKKEEPADDFESKVVKIMRLQKELPELIEQVNVLYGKIYTLKEKLLELS